MDFGVYVCSACSGIHREMTHKVKGVSMSNFTDKEAAFLAEKGNVVSHIIQHINNTLNDMHILHLMCLPSYIDYIYSLESLRRADGEPQF